MNQPVFTPKNQPTTFYRSLMYAWSGLVHTVLHQRNMRMHVLSGIMVSLVGAGIPLGLAEKVTLIFCVMLVLFAEMMNSALEQMVDLATTQIDERARLTKDIAAAGVLVLAIGTAVIFAAVLVHNADAVLGNLDAVHRQVLVGGPLTLCAGGLMHESRKPVWADALFLLAALGCWLLSITWTESQVFSSMTLGFLIVCTAAAVKRRRLTNAAQ